MRQAFPHPGVLPGGEREPSAEREWMGVDEFVWAGVA